MTVDPQLFEEYRYLLFSIAYRMLGSAMEAEDMVQEAFLRYQNAADKHIQSPKAYLTTIVTRLCLDQLKSAKTQREEYVGTWLPEPIFTGQAASTEGQQMESESISMAFMVLLENLSPVERAVFLLREVFDYDYAAIAGIVNKSEANCRRYYHLAKGYLVERRPRFEPASGEQFKLVERFMHAIVEGDIDGLTNVLAEDIVVYGDGGGKAPAARVPIAGREMVMRFLVGLNKLIPPDIHAELHNVNGALSFVFWYGGKLSLVMNLTIVGDRVTAIHNVLNPDKLVFLNQSPPPDDGVEIPAS